MQRAEIKDYCRSCKYYYGKVHALGPLVCAPHPYGPEVASCPDWELNLPMYGPPPRPEHYARPPVPEERHVFEEPPQPKSMFMKLWERLLWLMKP